MMIAAQTDLDVVRPSCELCGGGRSRHLWTLSFPGRPDPFRLFRCGGCGVVFNHPRLSVDLIHGQYDGDYYVFHERPERRWSRATQLYVEHLLGLEPQAGRRRLLEIGCAGGELLALARARGWQTRGIEVSPHAAESARRDHGLDVLTGTIEKHANHAGEFDVVIANDVIEHVPSPRLFLTHLRSVLRPGGWLSLETPNWGGIWRRVGGPRWLGLNPFHVFLFDARCLTRLMAQCGFRDCRAGSSTNCAHAAWGSRPELHPLWQCLPAALRWRLERFLDRLTPPSFALALRHDSPPSIEDALTRIEIVRRPTAMPSARLTGDNLMVIGRA